VQPIRTGSHADERSAAYPDEQDSRLFAARELAKACEPALQPTHGALPEARSEHIGERRKKRGLRANHRGERSVGHRARLPGRESAEDGAEERRGQEARGARDVRRGHEARGAEERDGRGELREGGGEGDGDGSSLCCDQHVRGEGGGGEGRTMETPAMQAEAQPTCCMRSAS
jgi:hypothetical protein